jgi:hypothetical protein
MRHLMIFVVLGTLTTAGAAFAHNGDNRGHHHHRECARSLNDRTAEQVMEDHRAALAAGDWDAARCDYAEDAVVVSDQGVTRGRDNIVADLQAIGGLFGGVIPQVNEEVIVSILNDRAELARILFSISTECIDIPDGTDTYIVRNGKIQAQTAHGFPVFKCGPPPGPPPAP